MSEPRAGDGPGREIDRRGLFAGIVFVVVGVVFLLDELDVLEVGFAYVLPLLLIAAGVWILVGRAMSRRRQG